MESKFVITWIIFLFHGVAFSSSSTVTPTENNIKASETLYDAIVKKCPVVEETNLKSNTIFTEECLNWEKINATNTLNDESKQDVLCLVYYESIVSFCAGLGDNAHKFKDLFTPNISKEKYNICSGNISIYPRNTRTEHNISKLIADYTDCLKVCWDGEKIRDICNLAYYFNTFNLTKLSSYMTALAHIDSNPHVVSTVEEIQSAEAGSSKNTAPVEKIPITSNKNPQSDSKPNITVQDVKSDKSHETLNEKPKDNIVENSMLEPEKSPKSEKTPAPEKQQASQTVEKALEDKQVPPDEFEEQNIDQQEEEEEEEEEVPVEPARHNEENLESNKKVKPNTLGDSPVSSYVVPGDDMDGNSYFFSYFTVLMCLCIAGYVGYHNRQKILALILEGKKDRKHGRGRRPNSANYHKLDSNLEEAMSSSCPKGSSNVIY